MDTKRRSYDIYDIEERVHALELGGGSPSPTPPTPSSGDVYSETETEIGTYLDKPLYRKVIPSSKTSISDGNNDFGDVSSIGIDMLVKARLVIKSTTSDSWSHAAFGLGGAITKSGHLVIKTNDSYNNVTYCKAIIEYTKVANDQKSAKRSKK